MGNKDLNGYNDGLLGFEPRKTNCIFYMINYNEGVIARKKQQKMLRNYMHKLWWTWEIRKKE